MAMIKTPKFITYSRSKPCQVPLITLFRPIAMLCGIDNILQNIPRIHVECENISQNIVSPIEHCYGSE